MRSGTRWQGFQGPRILALALDSGSECVTSGDRNLVTSARQRGKLERFGIRPGDLDALAISEEVGATKPAPGIFAFALARLGVAPARAIMIGDSWENDVLGALGSGMAAVWLNRYRRGCPDSGRAIEIRGFEPLGDVLPVLGVGPL